MNENDSPSNRPLSLNLSFGITNKADIMAKNIKFNRTNTIFDVVINKQTVCAIELIVPGLHNVYNALSAISICLEIDIPIRYIKNCFFF